MVDTIVFLTPHYLNFASEAALSSLNESLRTVLIAYHGDALPAKVEANMADIFRVDGDLNRNVRPVLDQAQCHVIVAQEVASLGGDTTRLRIFCQEECHVELAATLREAFGIEGDTLERVANFRDKVLMKTAVDAHGIRIPRFLKLDRERWTQQPSDYYHYLRKTLGNPLVIKPVNSAGSFEVSIVYDEQAFLHAREQVMQSPFHFEYEVDEFINGKMYQCDSFIVDGQVVYCGVLELGCTNFDFVQGQPLSVIPVLDPVLKARLEAFNRKVIAALDFQAGSTHHELFVDPASGEPIFLEIAARVPGGIGVPYHARNSEINLIDANLYLTAGSSKLSEVHPRSANNVVSALLPLCKGKIIRLREPPINSPYTVEWKVSPGMIVDSRSLVDTAGILTFYNDDPQLLRADFLALQNYQPVEVESPSALAV